MPVQGCKCAGVQLCSSVLPVPTQSSGLRDRKRKETSLRIQAAALDLVNALLAHAGD